MRFVNKILRYLVKKLIGPPPRFKEHDVVQLEETGPMMLVRKIKWMGPNAPYKVYCEWFEREKNCFCKGVYDDPDLIPFDWSVRNKEPRDSDNTRKLVR
jgi:uncharacterized protein YodC (DUF2158 family)